MEQPSLRAQQACFNRLAIKMPILKSNLKVTLVETLSEDKQDEMEIKEKRR